MPGYLFQPAIRDGTSGIALLGWGANDINVLGPDPEAILGGIRIPRSMLGPDGALYYSVHATQSSNSPAKTWNLRYGNSGTIADAIIQGGTTTTERWFHTLGTIHNRGTGAQVLGPGANLVPVGVSALGGRFGTVDTTADSLLSMSAQGDAAQNWTIRAAFALMLRPSVGGIRVGGVRGRGSLITVPGVSGQPIAKSVTAETVYVSVPIPGRSLGPHGMLYWWTKWSHSSLANAKTVSVRFGPAGTTGDTLVSTGMTTANNWAEYPGMLFNTASESAQLLGPSTSFASFGASNGATNAGAVDTRAPTFLSFTGSNANGADTLTLEGYFVALVRP